MTAVPLWTVAVWVMAWCGALVVETTVRHHAFGKLHVLHTA
jgi:hypothetical protein